MNRLLFVSAALIALASRAMAQCADGSAPPCRTATPAARTPANAPLDDRRWIVLPFTNTARAADLDWLGTASVNLLTLDLSRWSDVHVVAAERVDDLLRGVTEAARTRLGLEAGLEIAKRAGAAQLVMGEYLKQGARIAVTARVFNVRTGERVRSVSEPAQTTDSVAVAYERLAPKVVNLALPPGTTLAGLGTSSVQAIRSYTLGMQALTRGRSDSATFHLLDATRFDSTFALAHFRLATFSSGVDLAALYPGGAARARATAARLSSGLPERERLIIAPALGPCEKASRLFALDSTDAEAWFATVACNGSAENARLVVGPRGEVTRKVSYQAMLTAIERALSLQAHRGSIIALQGQFRGISIPMGCTVAPPCTPDHRYWAELVVEGDTLAARFEPINRFEPPVRRSEFAAGRLAKFAVVSDVLARWTVTHPDDLVAHAIYGEYLMQLGDFAGASREFDASHALGQLGFDGTRAIYFTYRGELEWKLGRPERAIAMYDSAGGAGQYQTAFARFSRGVGTNNAARRPLATAFNGVYAGVVRPDFAETMRAYAATDTAFAGDIIEVGTTLAFHTLRSRPAADTAAEFSLFRFQAFLAAGDVAAARRALAEYDAWGSARADHHWDAYEMFAAESHLELGDTATAWSRIEPFARRWSRYDIYYGYPRFWGPKSLAAAGPASSGYLFSAHALGRAWLLYADLAMATGHTAEARRGYQMIIGMWEKGEAPVQPLVKRAKDALVALGG